MVRRRTRKASIARPVVGYVRMSPGSSDASPSVQGPKIAAWCEREGYDLVCVFFDFHVSGGAELSERPGLAAAIATVQEGRLAGLAVAERTRLARDAGIASSIERHLERVGAHSYSADGRGNGANDDAAFDRDLDNILSARERRAIRRRTRDALAVKKAAGFALGCVPYGYQRGPVLDPSRPSVRRLEPNAAEQTVLARARALDVEGLTCRAIAETLNAEGYRNRAGAPFAHSSVHTMLSAA